MKKRIAKLSLTVLLLLISGRLAAAPCYGPNMPEKRNWDLGTEVHFLLERKMESPQSEFKTKQYFVTLSYGISDWFSLDTKIGMGHIKQYPEAEEAVTYNINFAGAYGFRIRAYRNEEKKITGIVGFQHISVHPDGRGVTGVNNDIIADDWQLSFLVAKDYQRISPYCGFKISRHDLIHKVGEERKRKKSADWFGLFLGLDAYLNDKIRFNLEGRFLDETAVSTALIRKF